MHKWQSVYEYRHVVAVGSQSVLYFILVDYLCVVVVNVIFVYELYVALLPIVERQCLDVVLLYGLVMPLPSLAISHLKKRSHSASVKV